jgi:excisionase family DNA binding protein
MASLNFIRTRLVGTNIAAKKLGIPERTVRYRAATGSLRAIRVGKLWKFPLDQISPQANGRAGGSV